MSDDGMPWRKRVRHEATNEFRATLARRGGVVMLREWSVDGEPMLRLSLTDQDANDLDNFIIELGEKMEAAQKDELTALRTENAALREALTRVSLRYPHSGGVTGGAAPSSPNIGDVARAVLAAHPTEEGSK